MTETGWIQTFTSRKVHPLNLRPEDIDIKDIAHALSLQCRFAGHVKQFYSVAEHSIRVSHCCDKADALWGLLHDASEAYLVDLPKPLKCLPEFAAYRSAEQSAIRVICQRFGLPVEQPESVTKADATLLATEALDLMAPLHPDWQITTIVPLMYPTAPLDWQVAEHEFLHRFSKLSGEFI